MRVIQLEPGGIPPSQASLMSSAEVCLAFADPATEAMLADAGIAFTVITDEVPADALLVLPMRPLDALAHITDRLLGPGGCPWDQAQTHESLKKHLLEEAYEVLDAIDTGSAELLREELGDLLLQPVLHAQMRKLKGDFDIDDVARGITDKLIRRHPHVFGDLSVEDADEVLRNWDRIKQQEKGGQPRSLLAGVPAGMASLLRAHDISRRAARAGFEWPDIDAVFAKLREEENELREAIANQDPDRIESEVGDLLFTAVNVARWAGVEPEEALRKMLNRFTTRFRHMEEAASRDLSELDPTEWDRLWEAAKSAESEPGILPANGVQQEDRP